MTNATAAPKGIRLLILLALVTGLGLPVSSAVPATMEIRLLRAMETDTLNDVQNAVIVKVRDLKPTTARLIREVAEAGPLRTNAADVFRRSGGNVGFWIEPDVVLLFKYKDQNKLRMAALHIGHLHSFRVVPTDSRAAVGAKPVVPSCDSDDLACIAAYLRPLGAKLVGKSQCPIEIQKIEKFTWQPVSGASPAVNHWLKDLANANHGSFAVSNVNEPTPPVVTLADGRFVNHPAAVITLPSDITEVSDVQFKLLLQYNFGIRDLSAQPPSGLMWCVQIGSTD
jgi:hypothetical protein